MSVQDLIEKYKKEYAENIRDYNQAINDRRQELYANIINDLKQVEKPKKAVLPKIADEFIKEGLSMGSDKVDIIGSAVSFSSAMPTAEFSMWFKTNGDLLIDALANGYEVEKEPLYYVKLPEIGYARFGFCIPITESIEEAQKYTEQEIKAVDERYWPFAVKVGDE